MSGEHFGIKDPFACLLPLKAVSSLPRCRLASLVTSCSRGWLICLLWNVEGRAQATTFTSRNSDGHVLASLSLYADLTTVLSRLSVSNHWKCTSEVWTHELVSVSKTVSTTRRLCTLDDLKDSVGTLRRWIENFALGYDHCVPTKFHDPVRLFPFNLQISAAGTDLFRAKCPPRELFSAKLIHPIWRQYAMCATAYGVFFHTEKRCKCTLTPASASGRSFECSRLRTRDEVEFSERA